MELDTQAREVVRQYNISQNIKQLIRTRKFTYKEISKKSGLKIGTIQRYASALKKPTDGDIELLAKAFGCDPSYLTRIENDPVGCFDESEIYKGE